MTTETAVRCPCGALADGWPGEGDDELCQSCWEKACDEAWWEAHQAVARVLHPETFPDAPHAPESSEGGHTDD